MRILKRRKIVRTSVPAADSMTIINPESYIDTPSGIDDSDLATDITFLYRTPRKSHLQ